MVFLERRKNPVDQWPENPPQQPPFLLSAPGAAAQRFVWVARQHGIGELVLHAGLPEAMIEVDRELDLLDLRRAAMEQQRRDIEAVLQEIDMLERQCEALLGDNAEGAAAARAELVRRIDRASVG